MVCMAKATADTFPVSDPGCLIQDVIINQYMWAQKKTFKKRLYHHERQPVLLCGEIHVVCFEKFLLEKNAEFSIFNGEL